jgi:hypothetical protein
MVVGGKLQELLAKVNDGLLVMRTIPLPLSATDAWIKVFSVSGLFRSWSSRMHTDDAG